MTQSFAKRTAVTVGVGLKSEPLMDIKESLSELNELVGALGASVIGSVVQKVESWNAGTLMGSGKIEEIQGLLLETKAQFAVVDHHLTGSQERNLSELLKVPVLDRTQLIIAIFASRAHTHEGKLQVELAQLLDQYSRMVGAWQGSHSRLGGGIGTRGPGEKAIEMDRRTIRKKTVQIRRELQDLRKHRALHRSARKKSKIPTFALIGYTNAGKSTLLNRLTKSNVVVANQMFATLDPATRRVFLPGAPPALVTDTVGFIRKLPPYLVEAFKATLEETSSADVLIHVVDLSHHDYEKQMAAVNTLATELGWQDKPTIYVFNKSDQTPTQKKFRIDFSPRIFVSALNGEGIDDLKRIMIEQLEKLTTPLELFFSHKDRHLLFELGRESQILKQEESSQGVLCVALLTENQKGKWSPFYTRVKAL